jgi:ATP synthase protein I
MKQLGVFVTIPFVLALPPIAGWVIGSWIDKHYNTTPVWMYIFLVLGFVAGIRECYRIIKRFGDAP